MEGRDGRTEKATPKKRNKERMAGNLCVSPEITSMAILLMGVVSLRLACPAIWHKLIILMTNVYRFDRMSDWTITDISTRFWQGILFLGAILAMIAAPVMLGAVIANMAQTGPYFSSKTLKWKFSAMNPVKGIKNLFSLGATVKMVLSILKIAVIIWAAYILLRGQIPLLLNLPFMANSSSLQWIFMLIFRLGITVVSIFVALAALDWIYRKYKHEQGMMMTKQEVRDERKQEEISPLIKRKQFAKMREFSLMRMMAAVPKASVVITNPTHVAVALEYDPDKMAAPKVTAKGLRLVAERIKKIASEHNIPIIERPAIARSLYKHVKVGHYIPARFYQAVAQVLAYLHKIGRGIKKAG